jgi:hypothetical protein
LEALRHGKGHSVSIRTTRDKAAAMSAFGITWSFLPMTAR